MAGRGTLSIDTPVPELFWDVVDPPTWFPLFRQAGWRARPNDKLGWLVTMWGFIIGLVGVPASAVGLEPVADLAVLTMSAYCLVALIPMLRGALRCLVPW